MYLYWRYFSHSSNHGIYCPIDWDDIIYASSGFITVIIMVLTYSISDGIAFGFIVYGLTSVVAGKGKDNKKVEVSNV